MSTSTEKRAAIEARIPHRPPFLLLDEIVEEGEDWALFRWTVPADADWFRGHYPEHPLTPGVLLTEHCIQGGAALIARVLAEREEEAPGVPVLTRIEDARYRRMVRPGETVESRVEIVERVGPAYRMRAKLTVEGKRTVTTAYVVTVAQEPA